MEISSYASPPRALSRGAGVRTTSKAVPYSTSTTAGLKSGVKKGLSTRSDVNGVATTPFPPGKTPAGRPRRALGELPGNHAGLGGSMTGMKTGVKPQTAAPKTAARTVRFALDADEEEEETCGRRAGSEAPYSHPLVERALHHLGGQASQQHTYSSYAYSSSTTEMPVYQDEEDLDPHPPPAIRAVPFDLDPFLLEL